MLASPGNWETCQILGPILHLQNRKVWLGLDACWSLGAPVVDRDLKITLSILECCSVPQHLSTCCVTAWPLDGGFHDMWDVLSALRELTGWKSGRRNFLTQVKMYSRELWCLSIFYCSIMRNQTMYLKKRGRKKPVWVVPCWEVVEQNWSCLQSE